MSPRVLAFAVRCALWLLLAAAPASPGHAQEFRALWADAFNIGLKNSTEVTNLVNTARDGNFNAIVAQVRKRGDAYYRNGLEPIATDVAAGFDPLADLLAKAHDTTGGKQRLEVHAWLVTYNIWNSQSGTPASASHPYRAHPEWLTEKYRADPANPATPAIRWDGTNYQLDQGHPAVQQHTFDVAMDVLTRYDVDGLHFDYIRYTDADSTNNNQPWGYHPVSVGRFNQLKNRTGVPLPTDPLWLQWRRDQVTAFLRKVYLNTWAHKAQARVSAALITYGNNAPSSAATFPTQSEAYQRVLQDWNGWMREGILDLACPMVYKTSNTGVSNWTDFIRRNQYSRAAAIGLGSYLNSITNNLAQMKLARAAAGTGEKASGLLGYSYFGVDNSSTTSNGRFAARNEFMAALTVERSPDYDPASPPLFAAEAALPAMPWKTDLSKGHLMGFAKNETDASALDGAGLTLTGPVNRTFISDGTGFFGSVDLPVGTYTLTISKAGFGSQVRAINITGAAVNQLPTILLGPPLLKFTDFQYNVVSRRANLTWTSESGQTFRVEYSSDLVDWLPHAATLASGGLSTTYLTPVVPDDVVKRWWRVKRL